MVLAGAIRAGDILVHHPDESFEDNVEHFIAAAATDPDTVVVKMTAYRVGDDTPFVQSLVRAAESGKQVACVIEIKARFDKERNLHWAAELERVGAHVTFGVAGLKTHAKLALVVRKESAGLRSYFHISTGNYHVRTARLYADCGLLTCDPVITRDVVNLFQYLTGHSVKPDVAELLVAPLTMRGRLIDLIRREITNKREGLPSRIVAKMNQLEDPEMIEALSEASAAGVPIDLIVRGFCCLRPGLAGRTENIRVRSIIGRFLEHSRIFYFAAWQETPSLGNFFIGSADWMFRNLRDPREFHRGPPGSAAWALRCLSTAARVTRRLGSIQGQPAPVSAHAEVPDILCLRTLNGARTASAVEYQCPLPPKFVFVGPVHFTFGFPIWARLNRLNTSVRNLTAMRSLRVNRFSIELSICQIPGARTAFRGKIPKTAISGGEKAAGLSQRRPPVAALPER